MKIVLLLVLALWWTGLCAQAPPAARSYTNAQGRYQLRYPRSWQVQAPASATKTVFYAGESRATAAAAVQLVVRPLPGELQGRNLLAPGQLDSLRRMLQSLQQVRILRLSQQDGGFYQEIRYDYSYAPGSDTTFRTHLLGRQIWCQGQEYWLEYRAPTTQDGRYLAEGQALLESFALTKPLAAANQPVAASVSAAPSPARPSVVVAPASPTPAVPERPAAARGYAARPCDDKMYGIVALRYRNEQWEDDCRTIHEFSASDPATAPKVHREALPFQSYALAKGFDNRLYSATKAPTNRPEYVYCYDPATRRGRYTGWRLPAQGPDVVWISAATDERGDLYFMTSDANKLVRVSPTDSSVRVLWTIDPARQASYYSAIKVDGASTHGNFCLDETGTLYQIFSTDGSLLRISLVTRQPGPALTTLTGLPRKGGYSDLLFQKDAAGRRRLYLAGAKALYEVDLERREARYVRKGIYTDLAGCNLFRTGPPPRMVASAAKSTWRGRVLDAVTRAPLPQAQLRLRAGATDTTLQLTPQGGFAFVGAPGQGYAARVQLPGYLTTDSTYQLRTGTTTRDLLLQPLTVGTTLRLRNVQFEQSKTRLLRTSYPALDQLLAILKENPTLTIELRGHTDNVGEPEKNQVLSEQRVAAVKIYLVGLGIAEKRISGVGLGGTEPCASNTQEVTRRLNRRVEFRVTGWK